MTLFSDAEVEKITSFIDKKPGNFLITFRNKHGPSKLKDLWIDFLDEIGFKRECMSWWSSTGTIGLLECDTKDGTNLYGQWALADKNELIAVMEMDDEDLVNIREGFDSGNVTSYAMRAIRIGETGDRD
ncbi:hypothetical protein EU546_07450 [Candidatus Thorarchaeota archaeon]|nr:MAG: hypothetical protein EU546_07450 [Candidatus Thorarchaeota archaeon]